MSTLQPHDIVTPSVESSAAGSRGCWCRLLALFSFGDGAPACERKRTPGSGNDVAARVSLVVSVPDCQRRCQASDESLTIGRGKSQCIVTPSPVRERCLLGVQHRFSFPAGFPGDRGVSTRFTRCSSIGRAVSELRQHWKVIGSGHVAVPLASKLAEKADSGCLLQRLAVTLLDGRRFLVRQKRAPLPFLKSRLESPCHEN